MSSRILLVNPWIYDFAAYDLWSAPLGLLYIGAVLRQAGYEVDLLDCLDRHHPDVLERLGRDKPKIRKYGCGKFYRTIIPKPEVFADVPRHYARYGIPLASFDRELAYRPRPDAVLVTSGMTYWYPGVFEAIRRIRDRYPEVPVVLGGVYATLCASHARAHSGADYVVAGGDELTALSLVDELTGQCEAQRLHDADLDALPYPAYDLRRPLDHVSVTTSRGCPFHCTYCASDLLQGRFRRRSAVDVAAEIRHWREKYGVRDIAFFDDALLVNRKTHIQPILDRVIAWDLGCRFHTPNGLHARLIDRQLAAKMYAAGFKTLRLSLETVNMDRQREIGPKVTAKELRRAVEELRAVGFTAQEIGVYILMGLPDQPLREVMASIDYVHDCGARAYIALYSPIPGTAEWTHAVATGQIAADADPLLHNNTIYPILRGQVSAQACQQVKDYARTGNAQLL